MDIQRHLMRPEPSMPEQMYKTYSLHSPLGTHWRSATCEEVECTAYFLGWQTTVPKGSQDEYVIRNAGRKWVSIEVEDNQLTFVFPPGQPCFKSSTHKLPLERPSLFVIRDGDHRTNPGTNRRVVSADEWVGRFSEHQDKINNAIQEG